MHEFYRKYANKPLPHNYEHSKFARPASANFCDLIVQRTSAKFSDFSHKFMHLIYLKSLLTRSLNEIDAWRDYFFDYHCH